MIPPRLLPSTLPRPEVRRRPTARWPAQWRPCSCSPRRPRPAAANALTRMDAAARLAPLPAGCRSTTSRKKREARRSLDDARESARPVPPAIEVAFPYAREVMHAMCRRGRESDEDGASPGLSALATNSLRGGGEKNDRAAGASPFIPPRTPFAPNADKRNSQPVDSQTLMVG